MSTREKRMLILLSIIGVVGIAFAAYSLVLTPLRKYKEEQKQLSQDEFDKEEELAAALKKQKQLKDIQKRNLPAEIDVAKREYEAALTHVIRTAGVPPGYTIVPQDSGDLGRIPLFADRTPVYSRFGYNIRLQKVDLEILAKFMKGYYDLNLLHQITKLDIKHIQKEQVSGPSRRGAERADLEVILHTEAVILSGAEKRQTLSPLPVAVAAVGGNVAYRAALNRPEFNRVIKPTPTAPLLAYTKGNSLDTRDYLAMVANDVFHGLLPKPKEPEAPKAPVVLPPPPLEDISAFLKLNAVMSNSAGKFTANIWDVARNHTYEITTEEGVGGKLEYKSRRFFQHNGKWRPYAPKELGIQITSDKDEFISTNHDFKILGFYQDGLLLSETTTVGGEKEVAPKEQPKKGFGQPSRNTTPSGKGAPTPSSKGATTPKVEGPKPKIAGEELPDAAAPAPAPVEEKLEKFYFWRVGQTLKTVVSTPLSYRERSILLANIAEPKFLVSTEAAPMPRVNANLAN